MLWGLFILVFLSTFLTFFCGFGLGTLLFAVLLPLYPAEIAISFIAVIHLSQSVFKVLLNRAVSWRIFIRFGLSSMVFALLGALLLDVLVTHTLVLYRLDFLQGKSVTLIKFLMGILLLLFAVIERWKDNRWKNIPLWLGGALSGFFGGLSGHQGALRSIFLIDNIKEKGVFIATGAMISVANDVVRLSVYTQSFSLYALPVPALLVGIFGALLAVIIGTFTLKKVSFSLLQTLVFTALCLLGLSLLIGWV
jgi:uncharacterized membrane protein YfcA